MAWNPASEISRAADVFFEWKIMRGDVQLHRGTVYVYLREPGGYMLGNIMDQALQCEAPVPAPPGFQHGSPFFFSVGECRRRQSATPSGDNGTLEGLLRRLESETGESAVVDGYVHISLVDILCATEEKWRATQG